MATECRQDSPDFGTIEGRSVVGASDGEVISSKAGRPAPWGDRQCDQVGWPLCRHLQ
jgi:hypothetical protein